MVAPLRQKARVPAQEPPSGCGFRLLHYNKAALEALPAGAMNIAPLLLDQLRRRYGNGDYATGALDTCYTVCYKSILCTQREHILSLMLLVLLHCATLCIKEITSCPA
jgi:hypothetical protein